jgi:hypothetical protein
MSRRKRQVDHGSWELKCLLRRRLLRMVAPASAVDLFAGEGRLLFDLYRRFGEVHAVEKDALKWVRLRGRLEAGEGRDETRVRTYCLDNRDFVRTRLAQITAVNYLDFDAYGDPHPLIQEAFKVWKPDRRAAIAVTDGGRMGLLRGGRITLGHYRPDLSQETTSSSITRIRPLSAPEYELLVRSFWKEMAGHHHFTVLDFTAIWRRGRRVLYYGVCLEPD